MPRKRFSTEQIITKVRQAEVELGRGLKGRRRSARRSGSASRRTTGGGRSAAACGSTKRNG